MGGIFREENGAVLKRDTVFALLAMNFLKKG